MSTDQTWHVRAVTRNDRSRLGSLLPHATQKHFHLDWFSIYEILGEQPFLIMEEAGNALAVLACPPDPIGVSWMRLFAVQDGIDPMQAWSHLWQQAKAKAPLVGAKTVVALSTHAWFNEILQTSGFPQVNDVLFLEWTDDASSDLLRANELGIRTMHVDDLEQVEQVDNAAFTPVWSLSRRSLIAAHSLASLATVVEDGGEIIAYQITTASALGAHLARLAVFPDRQGHGYGRALVQHVIRLHARRGLRRVSVNTQSDNLRSQELYKSLGFQETGQRYPLFQIDL